jgi:hypothetical protein
MKNNIFKKIIFSLSALSLLIAGPIFAQTYSFVSGSGLGTTADSAGYATTSTTSIESLIGTAILTILGFVGVLFLGLVIYGAIIWMTAEGNEEKSKKALQILTDSIIGLIITLSAYAVTYYLISYFWK